MQVQEVQKQASHSTVEKQRRDRINSLIDELREIVPPSSTGEGLDSRRPKHIVLGDAITLIKRLQTQDVQTAHAARPAIVPTSASHLGSHLPLAPDGAAAAFGVVVEESADEVAVKVHCRDRRSLLSDIVAALSELDLQVTTAAVTTTREGNVFNVFRVRSTSGSNLSPELLQQTLFRRVLLDT